MPNGKYEQNCRGMMKVRAAGNCDRIWMDKENCEMFRLDSDKPVEFCDGLRRRDFLHAGTLPFLGFGLTQFFGLKAMGAVDTSKSDVNCIMLMLIGGPSQLDTFDMKPNAPIEIRGPYKPIKTNVSGIEISENCGG